MAESNIAQDIRDGVLNAIQMSQSAVVDGVERWAATAASLRAELPDLPFTGSLNVAGRLPRPEDLVKGTYDFAEQLLAGQRKFAEDVLTAAAPLLGATCGATSE
jgi:hypothetical protein